MALKGPNAHAIAGGASRELTEWRSTPLLGAQYPLHGLAGLLGIIFLVDDGISGNRAPFRLRIKQTHVFVKGLRRQMLTNQLDRPRFSQPFCLDIVH